MLNSLEHEINPAHKCTMPADVGFVSFMSRINFMLICVEPITSFYSDYFIISSPEPLGSQGELIV